MEMKFHCRLKKFLKQQLDERMEAKEGVGGKRLEWANGRNGREKESEGAKLPWLILTSSWKWRWNYKGENTT